MRLVLQSGADRRRENLPIATELAGILPDEFTDAFRTDLAIHVEGEQTVYFADDLSSTDLAARAAAARSTLHLQTCKKNFSSVTETTTSNQPSSG